MATRKAFAMFNDFCPNCRARVEIPAPACSPDRTDLSNLAHCDQCDCGFDYDDEDVTSDDGAPTG